MAAHNDRLTRVDEHRLVLANYVGAVRGIVCDFKGYDEIYVGKIIAKPRQSGDVLLCEHPSLCRFKVDRESAIRACAVVVGILFE